MGMANGKTMAFALLAENRYGYPENHTDKLATKSRGPTAVQRWMEAMATTTLNDIIGENIRRLRKSQRMTQQKLARAVYGNQDMVCNWELGKHAPSAYYLVRIADVLGCSVDELLGRKEKERRRKNEENTDAV